MKVRLLTGLSGPDFSLVRGDERDFPQAEAERLVSAGYAVPAEMDRQEATRPAAPEKTVAKDKKTPVERRG